MRRRGGRKHEKKRRETKASDTREGLRGIRQHIKDEDAKGEHVTLDGKNLLSEHLRSGPHGGATLAGADWRVGEEAVKEERERERGKGREREAWRHRKRLKEREGA